MSFRDAAAALTLVGWYLMAPPYTPDMKHSDINAPLAKWHIIDSYDSAAECQTSPDTARKLRITPNLKDDPVVESMASSVCIETDDPRLKGN